MTPLDWADDQGNDEIMKIFETAKPAETKKSEKDEL
jgi:hypothetical protein